jgi:hypothetical protein
MAKHYTAFALDYNFYLNNYDKFTFAGAEIKLPPFDANGKTARECFFVFDSTGKLDSCSEPELFGRILTCKKSVNLHLKQWAEGYDDLMLSREAYLAEFVPPVPAWVNVAFIELRYKAYTRKKANKA